MPIKAQHPDARGRAAFTLIEILIALTVLMLIIGAVTSVYRSQLRAVGRASGRFEIAQNLRFVENVIDRELRLAGGFGGQPMVVEAHPMAITFNVDLVTREVNDHSAVYFNPDADSLGTEGFDPARSKALPLVAKVYPTQFYTDVVGNRSMSETVAYFLRRDLTAARVDIYTLFRRVNDRDSTVVARNIQVPQDTVYFFRYWRTDAVGNLSQIPVASLPLYWDNATRVNDSIRVVDMRVNTYYRDAGANQDVLRRSNMSTRLINAGLLSQSTCGSAPLPARNIIAALQTVSGVPSHVQVTWDASLEETGAERDVALYMVQRRLTAAVTWEVLANVPASAAANYTYNDYTIASGTWVYAVVAQDCSPTNSSVISSANVIIP